MRVLDRTLRLAPSIALLVALPTTSSAQTVFVDANLTTGANDGSSWDDAFQGRLGLAAALAAAPPNAAVFVAAGEYAPGPPGDRTATFDLGSRDIFGGFAGFESEAYERARDGQFESILTGDLNGDDSSGATDDNAYHVLTVREAARRIDGFTITGGRADGDGTNQDIGGGIWIRTLLTEVVGCEIRGNFASHRGGGAHVGGQRGHRFMDCRFEFNEAGDAGGGMAAVGGLDHSILRTSFQGNRAGGGGGLYSINSSSDVGLDSCIFVDNEATSTGGGAILTEGQGAVIVAASTIAFNRSFAADGGGIRADGGFASGAGSILWGNEGPGGARDFEQQLTVIGTTPSWTHSIIEGAINEPFGVVGDDPQFVDESARDLRLLPGSPGIDAGRSGSVSSASGDFVKARRVYDDPSRPNVVSAQDMGAFERTPLLGEQFCALRAMNSAGRAGKLDATGSTSLAANQLTLRASDLSFESFGYLIVGRFITEAGAAPSPGGSLGNPCIAGPIGRLIGPGQVQSSGAQGAFDVAIDLGAIPTPTGFVSASAGDEWAFQAWHRDVRLSTGEVISVFTDGVVVRFVP